MQKILIVDDNKYIRFALTAIIEEAVYMAYSTGDGKKVLKEIKSKKPDLVRLRAWELQSTLHRPPPEPSCKPAASPLRTAASYRVL